MERYFLSIRDNRVFLVKTKIDNYSTFNPNNTDFQEIVYNYISLDINEKYRLYEIKSYTYITNELNYYNIKTIGYNFYTENGKKQSIIIFYPFEIVKRELNLNNIETITLNFYTLIKNRRSQVYQAIYNENIENLLNNSEEKSGINFTIYNMPTISSFTLFVKYKNNQGYMPLLTKQLILIELSENEIIEIINDKVDKIHIFDNLSAKTNTITHFIERDFIKLSTQENIHNNILTYNYMRTNLNEYTYFQENLLSQYRFVETVNNQNIISQNYLNNNITISSFIINEAIL